jgi:hypothetical protein
MKTEYYTYMHKRQDDGRIFYIGKGQGRRAWSKCRSKYWNSIVNKHGLIVEMCGFWKTEAEALEHEIFLIECFRKMGYKLANHTNGGEGISGYKFSEESKKKRSVLRTGVKLGPMWSEEDKEKIRLRNTGLKRSDETKKKLSIAKKGKNNPGYGKKQSVETIEKRRIKLVGKTHSEESRKKIAEAKMGEKNPMFGKIVSEETRIKLAIASKKRWENRVLYTCPHCDKGNLTCMSLNRWHGDKCKALKNKD